MNPRVADRAARWLKGRGERADRLPASALKVALAASPAATEAAAAASERAPWVAYDATPPLPPQQPPAPSGCTVPGCPCRTGQAGDGVLLYTGTDGEWLRWHGAVRDGRYEDVGAFADEVGRRAQAGFDDAERHLARTIEAGYRRALAAMRTTS